MVASTGLTRPNQFSDKRVDKCQNPGRSKWHTGVVWLLSTRGTVQERMRSKYVLSILLAMLAQVKHGICLCRWATCHDQAMTCRRFMCFSNTKLGYASHGSRFTSFTSSGSQADSQRSEQLCSSYYRHQNMWRPRAKRAENRCPREGLVATSPGGAMTSNSSGSYYLRLSVGLTPSQHWINT